MKVLEKLCKLWEKNRDIKIIKTERRRNYLVPEPNYHLTKFFTENLLATKMKQKNRKKTQILINKPVYVGHWILELSKMLMYMFWYNYIKPKYGEKENCVIWTYGSFIVYIKTDDIYENLEEDVKTRFDASKFWIR